MPDGAICLGALDVLRMVIPASLLRPLMSVSVVLERCGRIALM